MAALALASGVGVWWVGVIPDSAREFVPASFAGLLLLAWGFARFPRARILSRLMLTHLTLSSTLIAADLSLRVLLRNRFDYRPHNMFVRVWPRLPQLTRYQKCVRYEGKTYGDLAAFSPDPSLREYRHTEFETDRFGFRNRQSQSESSLPYDVILAGDSFVAGCGSSQGQIWSELLRTRYGLRTYNLGMPGDPENAFLNLLTQGSRLAVHDDTVVLLAVFSGNDLTDYQHAIHSIDDIPWQSSTSALYDSLQAFRDRSSLRRLWVRAWTGWDPHESRLSPDQAGLRIREFPDSKPVLFYSKYFWLLDPEQQQTGIQVYGPGFERVLDDLVNFCGERHMSLKVVLVPAKEEVYQWIVQRTEPWSTPAESSSVGRWLEAVCRQRHLDYLDLKPAFVRESKMTYAASGEMLWWRDDSHWNPQGHALAARLVHRFLLDRSSTE